MSAGAPPIEIDELTIRFAEKTAIDRLSMTFAGGAIHGLLGRNGAGKSTLLAAIAAFRKPSAGSILLDGIPVFENPDLTRRICLIRESGDTVSSDERVEAALGFAAKMRPNWDAAFAAALLDVFALSPRAKIETLSRGQRSALGVLLGLASRSPVTMFDESYLGMDAPSRYAFYDALLTDVMERPRTVIVSTHLIEEVHRIFEQVAIIDRGRLLLQDDADGLRSRGAVITGAADAVDRVIADGTDLRVLASTSLGRTKAVTVFGEIDDRRRRGAVELSIDITPISLQDLFVHLTGKTVSPITPHA